MGSSLRWTALETIGSELTGFVLLLILARLLSPGEYGLMAMMGVFFAVTRILIDAGLSKALVQRETITADDETTVFIANVAMGAAVCGLLVAIAPLVATFFGEPLLKPLMQVLALKPLLSSFTPVQQALLLRDMDFRTSAMIEVSADLFAGLLTVALALAGFGVWSLVAQAVAWAGIRSGLLWFCRPWRPRGRFRWSSFAAVWPFSSRLLASQFLDTCFDRLGEIVVGRVFSAVNLGLFTRARQLQRAPTQAVVSMVGKVCFASYSRLQDEPEKLLVQVKRMQRGLAFMNAPMMLGLAVTAAPLTVILLSAKWAAAAPLLAMFALVGLLQPLIAQRQTLLTSLGRTDTVFRFTVARHVLTAAFLAMTWRHGPLAVAGGVVAQAGCSLALVSWMVARQTGYRLGDQLGDLMPGFAAGGLAAAAAWAAGRLPLPPSPWIILAVQVAAGGLAWLAVIWTFRRSAFAGPVSDLAAMLGRKRKKSVEPVP